MTKEEIIPNAEQGVLVGKTDIKGREGILAELPNGKPIRLGGGEVVINEKSSTKYCKELSDINVKGGGVEFDCDLQKVANTDRASNKMPKDEWHQENAAKGTQVERTYYEEAHRYIENAKSTLEKSDVSSDGKYYDDEKYVKSAAGIAYAGVEQAAIWYIKLRGIEIKGSGIDAIKEALSKIDKRMLKMINYLYTGMHVDAYYRGYTKKIIIDDLMKEAESFIAYLKPFKNIAHYASGKYFKYDKKSVEQFLDDYNLPGFDIKLQFDNKPEIFFTIKQSRPRLTIRVKDSKNMPQMVAVTRITSVDGRKVEWHQDSAAEGKQIESTCYEEASRYISNAEDILQKSTVSKDGYYEDEKYVKSAAGIAYAGVEMAAKWYLKIKGIEPKGKGIEQIKDAISKVDKRMLKMINYIYNGLHIDYYYGSSTKKSMMVDLLNESQRFIDYLKPYKEIAHYASGSQTESLIAKHNLAGSPGSVRLQFGGDKTIYWNINVDADRKHIWVLNNTGGKSMKLISKITTINGTSCNCDVEWNDSYAAGGMEGLVPQGKLYDQAVDKMYKKLLNETESPNIREFNRIYEKKLKELVKKYNIPPKYLEL